MHVVVLGAGSLGSLVGGLLARANDVTLVGREAHVRAVRADGLRLTGELDLTVHPAARTALPASADCVVVTVKSFDTGRAAAQLAEMESCGAVLSLQNGMGNEATLADRLAWPVLAGTTTAGARLQEPGVVTCNGLGEVTLGPHGETDQSIAERVGDAFRAADIETAVERDMRRHLWRKLAVNAGINAPTALARVHNGAAVDGPLAATARAATREAVAVAREEECYLDPAETVRAMRQVAQDTASNVSSMRQDVRAGRRTEIDAINGYVVAQATDETPVNETLTGLVRAWEEKRDLR